MPISDSIQAEMQKVNALFGETVVKGRDFAALDKIYTVDARILPPGADLILGRENIKGFWQAAVAGMNVQDANVFPIWSIRIVTRDTDENATRTMIAVAVTRGLFFETLSVQSCGSLRVKECAEGILADLARQITEFTSVQ